MIMKLQSIDLKKFDLASADLDVHSRDFEEAAQVLGFFPYAGGDLIPGHGEWCILAHRGFSEGELDL